jgi:hypothetical protein
VTTTVPAVTSTTSPQVSVSQSGQTFTLTITGTATPNQSVAASLTQGLVAESVAPSEAPYLQSIFDGAGRGAIGGLIKAALRKFLQSLGPSGANKDLLKQIATFLLQNAFGGIDLNKALPDIENIINALLNESQGRQNQGGGSGGGTGGGTLPPGTYQFQGTITVGPGSGGGGNNQNQNQNQNPDQSTFSNPADRDSQPSRSPFGTGSP